MTNIKIPSISDLRRAAAGAAVGARLALGPERWHVLRTTLQVLLILGWSAFIAYLIAVLLIAFAAWS